MAVGDVYQVAVDYAVLGEHCVNVFGYRETTECTDDIPAGSLGRAFEDALIDTWAALLSDQVQFSCIYTRRVAPGPGVAFTVLSTVAGDVASESLPTTSALVISQYSALGGKSKRGRNYFAGLGESSQAGGKLESGVLAAWEAFAADLRSPIAGVGGDSGEWELAIWSPKLGTAIDVKSSVIRTNLGSMRSRRQRPGTS